MTRRRMIFAATLIATLIAATLPVATAPTLGSTDKINHIAAFVVLGALAAWAWPRTRLAIVALWMSAYGAMIEAIQMIPALGRSTEFADWRADTIAAVVTLGVVAIFRRRADRDRARG